MKAKLFGVAGLLALLVSSPSVANEITYTVVAQTYIFQVTELVAGSLTGTITTDGTLGVELSPSIITGWNFSLNDGVNPTTSLTTANSFVAYNFSDLLSATPSELSFNFSPTPIRGFQQNLQFTSSSNGARVVTIFSETASQSRGGIGFDAGYNGALDVAYLSGAQIIADSGIQRPASGPIAGAGLPGLLAGFGVMLAWFHKRRAVST